MAVFDEKVFDNYTREEDDFIQNPKVGDPAYDEEDARYDQKQAEE